MRHLIADWLDNDGPDLIEINDREITLEYAELRNGRQRYEMWEDGELIDWTDNHKVFLNIDLDTV